MRSLRPIAPLFSLLSLLVVVGLLTWTPPAAADPGQGDIWSQRHRLDLGLYAGVLFPPRAHELYDEVAWQEPFDTVAFDVGLRVGYMPWPFIGLELEGGVIPTQTREGGDSALLYTVRAHVIGQYPARFSPFLLAGYGILGVSSDDSAVGNDIDGAFHAGLGLKFHATKRLTLRLDGRLIVSGQAGPTGFMPYFETLLGASYMLYWNEVVDQKKDSDGDGVPDHKDRCPSRSASTPDGCPPADSDGDGVTDDKDKCPSKAGKTADGCPVKDSDGDGVTDDKDKCPDKAAETADGCPPADSDGDGDGVPDDKDKCPDKAAETADGCPVKDSDGDGVPDDKDKCPAQPETKNGHQDDDGCPDTKPVKFAGTFPAVRFWINSAQLRGQDMRILRRVVKALKKHPNLRIRLRGHADESGPEDYNMDLSRKRAEAVKGYLVRNGVKASQLEVEALGETEPASTTNQALNRRVEFKIISN